MHTGQYEILNKIQKDVICQSSGLMKKNQSIGAEEMEILKIVLCSAFIRQ